MKFSMGSSYFLIGIKKKNKYANLNLCGSFRREV
jgi:hypothetical protein